MRQAPKHTLIERFLVCISTGFSFLEDTSGKGVCFPNRHLQQRGPLSQRTNLVKGSSLMEIVFTAEKQGRL